MAKNLKYFLFIFYVFSFLNLFTQDEGGNKLFFSKKTPIIKTRIGFSPLIGFYKADSHYANSLKQKMSFCISIKEEIRLDRHSRSYFMIGAEYLYHTVTFSSYYFYKDSLKLYTGNMNATYMLKVHEIDIPLQFKHSFQKETDAILSTYVFGGYCYRLIIKSQLKVNTINNESIEKAEYLKFKLPVFTPNGNSSLNAGIGIQKKSHNTHNAIFAEVQFRYALSPFYFNDTFSPTYLFINSHFLLVTIGFKI